ncbi:MAG: ksgA [Deltaproteobacteria bacterium]|nr:ksgA [Deltaproteobacteria bacterium]
MLKKSFSQNLIKDGNTLRKMVSLAEITKDDTVIEIGAGRGDLTRAIAQCAHKVIAVELDRDMIPYLESLASGGPSDAANIEIVFRDILAVDIAGLAAPRKIKVMGNIPYGITGPIIFKLIGERAFVESAFLTVQKEIGDRITAKPGTRAYGSLSVICRLVADVKVLMRLKAHIFIPPPKVDSMYFSMHFRDDADYVNDDFMSFVRGVFSHKRKFMRNALREKYTDPEIDELYELMHFSRSVRAEELEPGLFRTMYRAIEKEGKAPPS